MANEHAPLDPSDRAPIPPTPEQLESFRGEVMRLVSVARYKEKKAFGERAWYRHKAGYFIVVAQGGAPIDPENGLEAEITRIINRRGDTYTEIEENFQYSPEYQDAEYSSRTRDIRRGRKVRSTEEQELVDLQNDFGETFEEQIAVISRAMIDEAFRNSNPKIARYFEIKNQIIERNNAHGLGELTGERLEWATSILQEVNPEDEIPDTGPHNQFQPPV